MHNSATHPLHLSGFDTLAVRAQHCIFFVFRGWALVILDITSPIAVVADHVRAVLSAHTPRRILP